jgi:hypothetical protein
MRNGRGECVVVVVYLLCCVFRLVVDIPGNGSAVLSFAHRHSVCAYVLYVHVSVVIDIRPRLFLSILYSKMSTFVCHGLRK